MTGSSLKAQEFYNKLASFYLEDNSVLAKLSNYRRDLMRSKNKKIPFSSSFQLSPFTEEQSVLQEYVDILSDEEISGAIKTFQTRMFPPVSNIVYPTDGVVIFKPQSYQSTILKSFIASL